MDTLTVEDMNNMMEKASVHLPYLYVNHKDMFERYGTGFWMIFSHSPERIEISCKSKPVYVPSDSINMFMSDINLYKISQRATDSHIVTVVICGHTEIKHSGLSLSFNPQVIWQSKEFNGPQVDVSELD